MKQAHVFKARKMINQGKTKDEILHYMSRWYDDAHVLGCVPELMPRKKAARKKKAE